MLSKDGLCAGGSQKCPDIMSWLSSPSHRRAQQGWSAISAANLGAVSLVSPHHSGFDHPDRRSLADPWKASKHLKTHRILAASHDSLVTEPSFQP